MKIYHDWARCPYCNEDDVDCELVECNMECRLDQPIDDGEQLTITHIVD